MLNLLKTFQECQHYEDANISLNEVWPQRSSKVTFMPSYSRTFVYKPILMKIFMNVTFILWRRFVIFFTLSPSDLITTLTCVLMDNLELSKYEKDKILGKSWVWNIKWTVETFSFLIVVIHIFFFVYIQGGPKKIMNWLRGKVFEKLKKKIDGVFLSKYSHLLKKSELSIQKVTGL